MSSAPKIAIIGGGMAGTAMAYVLKQAGLTPVLYEAGPDFARGASGNAVGLYNPRFTAEKNAQSDYYTSAFSLALRTFKTLPDIDWDPCGALHLVNDDKKAKRFGQTVQNWGWDLDHMRMVDRQEASKIAGVRLHHDALYLPQSGSVSPKKLCHAYMHGVDHQLNAPIASLDDVQADIKILACGPGVEALAPHLPIGRVRGQITDVRSTKSSEKLKCTVCYGGYFSRARNHAHIVGSTFQRWLDHDDILPEDDADNIQKLAENIPGMEQGLEVIGHRAAVRATSKDHFPIVGVLEPGVYVSSAHGSHGILSSLTAAHLIADMILDRPRCLPADTIAALSAERF